MHIELRNYQKECLEVLKKPINPQLIQLPTGSGKTIIFLSHLKENSQRALIIVPTKDLQYQIYKQSLNFYDETEVFLKKTNKLKENKKLFIIVANSLISDITFEFLINLNLDHIIIDEAHKAMCNTYTNFLDKFNKINTNYKLIGFTATPSRLDQKSLITIFGDILYSKNIVDLINLGHLCNIVSYRIKTQFNIDSKGKQEDFANNEIRHLDCYSRNKLIYETYFKYCLNKKTLIFCINVDHAEKIADYLRKEKGIKAHHISGRQTIKHREEILQKFKCGEIQVLTNCQLLTEGFDEPSINALIIARPTRSKALYCQMVGRGTRLFLNKECCYLYELTDNSHKICTFNVVADNSKDENFTRDYKDGISLTELNKEIIEISLKDFVLTEEKMEILGDFKSFLESHNISLFQKKSLEYLNINTYEPTNFLQACFLLFIERLKAKYGYNKKTE